MLRDEMIGVWELVSCVGQSSEGASFLPYGDNPIGKLIYHETGHLAVTLMRSERANFISEDISLAGVEEVVGAFSSFDAYSGRWVVDQETGRVEHRIECGRIPNWVDKTHVRFCKVRGDELLLSTEAFIMGGKSWQVHVTWRRG